MLHTSAPFPHPGAEAFLVGSAQPCRIIQRRADGLITIAIDEQFKRASSTRTVELTDLAESAALATTPAPRRRPRKARA